MKNLNERYGEILDKYYPLHLSNPENELLKYFILDSSGFRQNRDEEIKEEFLERFRRDFPTREFLTERGIEISLYEYSNQLELSLLQNYCNSLKEEIEYIEIKN